MLEQTLRDGGYPVTAVEKTAQAKDALLVEKFDIILTTLVPDEGDGISLLAFVKEEYPHMTRWLMSSRDVPPNDAFDRFFPKLQVHTGLVILEAVIGLNKP